MLLVYYFSFLLKRGNLRQIIKNTNKTAEDKEIILPIVNELGL